MMRTLMALALATLPVAAQHADPREVPRGYVRLEKVGKLTVWAPGEDALGPTARLAFRKELQRAYETYCDLFSVDRDIVHLGAGATTTRKEMKREFSLVLFEDSRAWAAWAGGGEPDPLLLHLGLYRDIFGIPLAAREFPESAWPILWHELAHVFIFNDHVTGGPLWLNEGLAEYFAFDNPSVKPLETESFRQLLFRLEESGRKKEDLPLADVLQAQPEDFGRRHMDASWVLAHLLMTEAKDTGNRILRAVAQLEAAGQDSHALACREDMRRYAEFLVRTAFGGLPALQDSWSFHRDALVADFLHPRKLPLTPLSLKDEPPFLALDGGWTEVRKVENPVTRKKDIEGRLPRGRVLYGGPWKGNLSVTAFTSDDGRTWEAYGRLAQATTGEKREPVAVKKPDDLEPLRPDVKWAKMVITWKVDGGGLYQVEEVQEFRPGKK